MNPSISRYRNVGSISDRIRINRGVAFGVLIIAALLAFEIFNYSTTDFALGDLLGELNFMGVRWATILAIAFCGIDFAGIARLFTPEEGADEPAEVWYLFGAWLLAATMNAMLTWWGVSIAILQHESLGNSVIARDTLLQVVPIFVAVMVWLIRVLIIGTFSVAGERLFSLADVRTSRSAKSPVAAVRTLGNRSLPQAARNNIQPVPSFSPAPKPAPSPEPLFNRPEPTYHPVSMKAKTPGNGSSQTRR
jgi:hypothetical protein